MTGYHGASRPVQGMGLIAGSNAVHYDKEAHRRPAYHLAIGGGMPGGYAVDDGAALHFDGGSLARVVSSRPEARAYRVEAVAGEVVELPLAGRLPRSGPGRGAGACRLSTAPGARAGSRPSSRWAAAASRWSRATPRSTTTCARSRRRGSRGSACSRPPAATPRTRSAAFTRRSATSCASRRTSRCSGSATRPGAAARAPARAGHHLRRRRLDGQPARALAGARARRDPARGVAGRDRPRRAERRLDVLVRVGRHDVDRAAGRSRAGSASCPARTRSTTTASPSAGRSTSTPSPPAAARRAGAWTTAPACCSAARGWPRSSRRGRARGPSACTRVDGEAVEEAIEPRLLKARPARRTRRAPLGGGGAARAECCAAGVGLRVGLVSPADVSGGIERVGSGVRRRARIRRRTRRRIAQAMRRFPPSRRDNVDTPSPTGRPVGRCGSGPS